MGESDDIDIYAAVVGLDDLIKADIDSFFPHLWNEDEVRSFHTISSDRAISSLQLTG